MELGRNDPCWCGSGQKWKKCHYPNFPLGSLAEEYLKQYGIVLKTPQQTAGIRRACRLAADILDKTCKMAQEGVTTNELDAFAYKLHMEAGARPAPLGFGDPPFPKSICTSLNEVICHGIPDDTPLRNGDILNIDVSCELNGYFGDCSRMVMVGQVSEEKKKVTEVCYECLMRSIAILKPGVLIKEIGRVITEHAHAACCSVVYQFVGHGIGLQFREPPQVPHHINDLAIPLVPGMTFTIEPMINAGVPEGILDQNDHWTVRTADGRASAQWEHMILITDSGYEILTRI